MILKCGTHKRADKYRVDTTQKKVIESSEDTLGLGTKSYLMETRNDVASGWFKYICPAVGTNPVVSAKQRMTNVTRDLDGCNQI